MLWAILLLILYYVVLIKIDTKRKKAFQAAKQNLVGQSNPIRPEQHSAEDLTLFGTTKSSTDKSAYDSTTTNKTSTSQTLAQEQTIKISDSKSSSSSKDIIESVGLLGQQLIKRQAAESNTESIKLTK